MSASPGEPPAIVVTHFPSPYQVELFNEVERQQPGALKAWYLFRRAADRSWKGVPVTHAHGYLDEGPVPAEVTGAIANAGFVIFNYYNDPRAAELIRLRAATGRPWCFWGERPGYRFPLLARMARLGRLGPLHASHQPIWGIGEWAVEAYRREFGSTRTYLNLPYYSNLERFQRATPALAADRFTFLYSGALSHRKGVELLAGAFLALAAEVPTVRLKIMGEGDLEPRLRRLLAGCDRVEWVGFKDWDELPGVYATAQALVVPSRHDGWGLVVPEGLAAGLPTIATNRTGAALDLIEPGRNGWLIEAGSGGVLLAAMREAAALDAGSWQAMSAQARLSIRDHTLAAGAARLLAGIAAGRRSVEANA